MDLDNEFGEELRYARQRSEVTIDELAKRASYSASQVAQVERGEKSPSLDFAKRMDQVLDTGGLLERIRARRMRHRVEPDWFRAYRESEQAATEIRSFEPLVMPGLLQTDAYARAILGDDERVQARLARQGVLERAEVCTVIAERVLHERVGSEAVMADQLAHLVKAPVVVQVLPAGAETRHVDLAGPLAIAKVDGAEVVYMPSALRGQLIDDPVEVSEARRRLDTIRAEALPRSLSRELIQRVMKQWENR